MQKVLHNIFYCHDQYEKSWSKHNQDRWKFKQQYFYYYIGYTMVKDLSYAKSNTADQLYPIIN